MYEALHPDFSMRLSYAVMEAKKYGVKYTGVFLFPQNRTEIFQLSEIEALPEAVLKYNTHAWNKFPDVTPPEGVWMRVEWFDAYGNLHLGVARYIAFGDNCVYVWMGDRGIIREVDRFRPLDEEDKA